MIRRLAALSVLAALAACSPDSTVLPSNNVAGVSLAVDPVFINVGDSIAPVVAVTVNGVSHTPPASEIRLASANPAIASVSTGGKLLAVAPGQVQVNVLWVGAPTFTTTMFVTVLAINASGVNYVQIRWVGSTPTPAVAAAFESARLRLNGLFLSFNNVSAINPTAPAETCLANTPALNEIVQGIIIFAQVTAIDGPGKILGSSGPCLLRDSNFLPVVATMKFDSVDMASMASNGTLNNVVLHEMMHSLGFGTIWIPGLQGEVASPDDSINPRYLGANGQEGYTAIGGTDASSGVPVENTGGNGTKGSHWRETIFRSELMTGWADGSMAMSRATIGALRDFGYDVDVGLADAFNLNSSNARASLVAAVPIVEQNLSPIGVVGRDGRITPYTGRLVH